MTEWVQAYVGVGANLGEREVTIRTALDALDAASGVIVGAVSGLIETAPHGDVPQPDYLNGAVAVSTSRSARDLLDLMLGIESALGRDRASTPRWGPRVIDLDLLLYGSSIIDEPGLRVPHPDMHRRVFVLEPLLEIAPDVLHPGLHATVRELHAVVKDGFTSGSG